MIEFLPQNSKPSARGRWYRLLGLCVALCLLFSGCASGWPFSKPSPTDSASPSENTRPPLSPVSPEDGERLTIVDTSKAEYSYEEMLEDLEALEARYPGKMVKKEIGKSLDGRVLYAVEVGNPNAEKQILITAGIHAREYLTPLLLMKQLEFYLYNYDTATYGEGEAVVSYADIFDTYRFCLVPMCNPDGIALSQFGLTALRSEELQATVRAIYASDQKYGYVTDPLEKYLRYWKANARGVDLNRNFDTKDWKNLSYTPDPCFKNYKGEEPHSEPETKALVQYTESLSCPAASVSLHSQGEVIYFDCGQDNPLPNRQLGEAVQAMSGYALSYDRLQAAAFDDWCTMKRGIPSVTVETGGVLSTCPLSIAEFPAIWTAMRPLWMCVATTAQNQLQ